MINFSYFSVLILISERQRERERRYCILQKKYYVTKELTAHNPLRGGKTLPNKPKNFLYIRAPHAPKLDFDSNADADILLEPKLVNSSCRTGDWWHSCTLEFPYSVIINGFFLLLFSEGLKVFYGLACDFKRIYQFS